MKKYTEDHEWLLIEGNIATVGITTHAAEQLGDLVYVELPAIGDEFAKGDEVVVIESVKAAGEVMAPCQGKIVAINETLNDDAEIASNDPEGDGWLFKLELQDISETESFLNKEEYEALF